MDMTRNETMADSTYQTAREVVIALIESGAPRKEITAARMPLNRAYNRKRSARKAAQFGW